MKKVISEYKYIRVFTNNMSRTYTRIYPTLTKRLIEDKKLVPNPPTVLKIMTETIIVLGDHYYFADETGYYRDELDPTWTEERLTNQLGFNLTSKFVMMGSFKAYEGVLSTNISLGDLTLFGSGGKHGSVV